MVTSDRRPTIKDAALAARFFRVLGNPTRLRLIRLLSRGFAKELGLPTGHGASTGSAPCGEVSRK